MKVILGTAQFGFGYGVANNLKVSAFNDMSAMLNFASLNNIKTIDTARSYGESELRLGSLINNRFGVITKISKVPDQINDCKHWTFCEINDSLNLLKISNFEAVLFHNPIDLLSKHGNSIYSALSQLKESGIIKKIGISIYNPEIIRDILNNYDINIIQAPLNIFDRRILEESYINMIKEKKIELHFRSIFLQGLLLMDINNIPHYFEPWKNIIFKWHQWLEKNNISALEGCIRFLRLNCRYIDSIVCGFQNLRELREFYYAINSIDDEHIIYPKFVDINKGNIGLIDPRKWILY